MATFKTRARALDMLGRQQIAGRPTAISELFKNAHDAYADQVVVDYYRSDGLFVLRDDGLGMANEDFLGRWLTLGTESKVVSTAGISIPPRDTSKPLRAILGEKGIGRLAIASIGPQVLILTRALRDNSLHDLVAAFIHWGLYELPGVDLDQIEIPVRTCRAGTLPTQTDVEAMVEQVRSNLICLKQYADPVTLARIQKELSAFSVDPAELDKHLRWPSLSGIGHGTHFYIKPADPLLDSDIDGLGDADSAAPPLIKALLGFTNTVTPDHAPPQIQASFRDHKTEDTYDELIGEQAFFTPAEFAIADHHVAGTFDEHGQFMGTVTVYGHPPVSHIVPWIEARGVPTDCGPFSINLAYFQGTASQSSLPPEQLGRILAKLNKIGGVYIYKDGVRVLPYGNTDYDFIDIERNRTKSASYYFFSYRRMFGVVETSQGVNPNLIEKAGREGFRENRAYRQFREILKNFFVQIAADFFREGGTRADEFVQRRAELERLDIARRKREKQATFKKNEMKRSIDDVLSKFERHVPQEECQAILESIRHDLDTVSQTRELDRAAQAFMDAEANARRKLETLRTSYRISRPRGIALPRQLERDWQVYVHEHALVDTTVFADALMTVDKVVGEAARKAKVIIDRRRRLERSIQDQVAMAQRVTNAEIRETKQTADEVRDHVVQLTRDTVAEVDASLNEVLSEFARWDMSTIDEALIVATRAEMEDRIVSLTERKRDLLEAVRDQLRSINLTPGDDGDLIGTAETTEALEQEVLALRERRDADLELAQLGMAIGVINHEFEATIRAVRSNLRRLKGWADVNEDLQHLYNGIRSSFDHLDGYLTLFTPLHRRIYRTPVDITGAEIVKFLDDLFRERLERHTVTLEASSRFRRFKFTAYPSTFYPVFVNLVDNALFWLRDRTGARIIRLEVDGQAMLVSDTGPGVNIRDRDAIFELGFTRKPGGRGMGLEISRQVLREAGYSLTLDLSVPGAGATFRIEPGVQNRSNEEAE